MKADYSWQDEAKKVVNRVIKEDHGVIPVNACVGSGKTRVAFYALAEFIRQHNTEKTFQIFVTPRIRLAKQQMTDCKKYLTEEGILNFGCYEYDCQSNNDSNSRGINKGWPEANKEFISYAQHVIFFVCADSLWNDTDTDHRTIKWEKILENNKAFNRLNGCIIYDEAHNYENKTEFIYGEKVVC